VKWILSREIAESDNFASPKNLMPADRKMPTGAISLGFGIAGRECYPAALSSEPGFFAPQTPL